jgi:hypothetical protein
MSQRKNAAFIPVYLFWAVLGVTLADEQMVERLAMSVLGQLADKTYRCADVG